MVLRIPNSCLRIIRTKHCIAVFTCFPPSSDKEHRCYDTSGSPGSDTLHPGVSRGEASGSVPSRVLPKSECRPAGLTGRLVYWRRDSERDGKRGEPEGEPSLNETGIQVFFVVVVLFLHLTRLFCGLFTSSVLIFPLVEDGICEPASACFFVNVSPLPTMKPRLFWIS